MVRGLGSVGAPQTSRARVGSIGATLRPLLWEARPRGESPDRGAGGKSLFAARRASHKKEWCEGSALLGPPQKSGARARVRWGNAAPAFVGGPPSGRIAWPWSRRKVPFAARRASHKNEWCEGSALLGLPRRKRCEGSGLGETLRPLLWEARPRGESPGRGAGGKSLRREARLPQERMVRGLGSVGAVTGKRCEGSGLLGKRCARFCGRPALGANCLDGEPAESPLRREARLPQERMVRGLGFVGAVTGKRCEGPGQLGLPQKSGARARVCRGNAAPAFVGGPPSGRIASTGSRRKVSFAARRASHKKEWCEGSALLGLPRRKRCEARLCWGSHEESGARDRV